MKIIAKSLDTKGYMRYSNNVSGEERRKKNEGEGKRA